MFSASVGRCKFMYLVLLYITLQICIVFTIIYSLASNNWVKSNEDKEETYSNYSSFKSQKFKGGINICYHGCEQVKSYKNLAIDICDSYSEDDSDYNKKICNTMRVLSLGGDLKIVFDTFTLFLVMLWFFFIICCFKNSKCFKATYCLSVMSCIFYFVGSLCWFGITSASFSNCDKQSFDNEERLNLCAIDGPAIVVTLMVFYPLIVGSFVTITIKANESRLSQEAFQNESIPQQPVTMVHINQPVNADPNYIINQIVNNADINAGGLPYQNHQNMLPNFYNNQAPQQYIYYHINNPGNPPNIQNYNFIIPPDADGNNPQVYDPAPNYGQNADPAIIYIPQDENNGYDSIENDFSK